MNLYLKTQGPEGDLDGAERLLTFPNGKTVWADTGSATTVINLDSHRKVLIFGDLFYHLQPNGKISLIDSQSAADLKKVFSEQSLDEVISALEGQYVGLLVDQSKNTVEVFSDRYARLDTFYALNQDEFYFATDLDFIFKHVNPRYDQKMLTHIFSIYGWGIPKGFTIYENVKKLRVGEILTISQSGSESRTIRFEPMDIQDYQEKDLETYYQILRQSVIARANKDGKTWVSISSGWDSTMLLALLVDEFGADEIGMITGTGTASERTGPINTFEVEKIKKIGQFFGIKPEIVDFNYEKGSSEYLEKNTPYFKARHVYTQAGIVNFTKLSDKLLDISSKGQTVFNGETSDSFHNFGFAQFITFFHTTKAFTEYADKMNCYLYGPSFFKKVLDGTYEKDKVFQIFQKMSAGTEFQSTFKDREARIESYLFPFFYGSPRVPFAKTYRNKTLAAKGQQALFAFPFRDYMPEVIAGLNETNIYSWLAYLYNSFHSQGSSVNIQKHAMELNGHKWRMPFHDMRIVSFLSKAPESWGRGLDLNHTKYPLKWVAQNKLKFPYDVLEEGPHSYLYDVIEDFSIPAELVYRSKTTQFYKDQVAARSYRDILSDEYFDVNYLDSLVKDFLAGKEASGADFHNLFSLINLSAVGWY